MKYGVHHGLWVFSRSRWSEQVRQLLCSHFGEMTWKMLYFLMTTAVCLLSFRNERWWPQQLGGEGAEEQLWQGEPNGFLLRSRTFTQASFYILREPAPVFV